MTATLPQPTTAGVDQLDMMVSTALAGAQKRLDEELAIHRENLLKLAQRARELLQFVEASFLTKLKVTFSSGIKEGYINFSLRRGPLLLVVENLVPRVVDQLDGFYYETDVTTEEISFLKQIVRRGGNFEANFRHFNGINGGVGTLQARVIFS